MFNFKTFMQKSPQQRFLLILGLVMFTFYFVLGLLLIFWTDIPFEIQKTYRILFGLLLIVYAAIRFARLINPKDD
ncbi:hypothetical protein GM920_14040 [Pedobacter sp. LMG 31462]|uniref:Uncharacterized protein n=2 Tax=Pedobacter gandavensis TaxID=2679963 RepID=A0ABR6EXN6_9SPHI|nr:hypothetical protein [Pedobacter gandavensis]